MSTPPTLQRPTDPMPTRTSNQSARKNRPGFIGPIILIGVGVVLLLNNLNVVGWEIWNVLLRLWPLILIAVGLDILIGRQSIWGSLVVGMLFLGMVAAGLYYLGVGPINNTGQQMTTEQVAQGPEGASRAQIELNPGVGNMHLAASNDSSTGLIAGSISLDNNQRVTRDFRVNGDIAQFTLRESSGGMFLFFPLRTEKGWDLRLARNIPIALTVRNGIGDTTIDLRDITLTDLKLSVGIGSTSITLSGRGKYSAKVDGGIGNLNLMIPEGIAARIRSSQGLGNLSVPNQFIRQGEYNVSAGYDTAENRVDLSVSGGIGNISVQVLPGSK